MEACPWGEPWRDFLASLLWGGAEGLYILSQLVLSVYAVWYIASLGAYFASTPTKAGPATGAWGGDYPRVAVVYPVYNDYEVLASLEKALNMDYPDYKIVVVDDSDDDRLSSRISEVASRSGGRVIHVRRAGRRGLKAGALNTAARIARELGAKYMLVLDADFEPERGLLRRMVSIAETTGADIVQGHQAHRKGVRDYFGLLYNSGMGGAIIFMTGRRALGMFPIFTGSVALLKLDRVLEIPFKEGSLSEDLRWTIEYALEYGLDGYVADPHSIAVGSVPKTARAFWRQQLRWSTGTTLETLETIAGVLASRRLGLSHKIGYLLQGGFYSQGLYVYIATLLPPLAALLGHRMEPWPLGLYLWLTGITTIILAGSQLERRSLGEGIRVVVALLPYIYYTSLIHAIGFIKALIFRRAEWVTTPKRGSHEEEYTW